MAVVITLDKGSKATGGGTTSDFILAYDYNGASVDSEGVKYYSYDAFVNGEETDIDSTVALGVGVLYTDISYDEYGYIDGRTEVDTDDWWVEGDGYIYQEWGSANKNIVYSGGVLTIGNDGVYALADNYDIYIVDADTGSYDSVTASRLAGKYGDGETITGTTDVYALLDSDGYVTALFVMTEVL